MDEPTSLHVLDLLQVEEGLLPRLVVLAVGAPQEGADLHPDAEEPPEGHVAVTTRGGTGGGRDRGPRPEVSVGWSRRRRGDDPGGRTGRGRENRDVLEGEVEGACWTGPRPHTSDLSSSLSYRRWSSDNRRTGSYCHTTRSDTGEP